MKKLKYLVLHDVFLALSLKKIFHVKDLGNITPLITGNPAG